MDFLDETVASVAARVRARDVSAREVTSHALATIEALNPVINAFVAYDGERALAQADAIDADLAAGLEVGPLAGIPVGVKDLEAVEGFTTTFGSALCVDDPPAAADSEHVARLRAAGCVIIGKTNTPEYGHKGATDNIPFGQTLNPWSTEHSPGGSSGGTAAALASGMVLLGTGSDGGGSIRIPASLCGFSGLKTETARIPITGRTMPGSGLLSTNGPMARRSADSTLALDSVIGHHGRDPLSIPDQSKSWADAVSAARLPEKVVWSPTMGFGSVDSEVASTCDAAVKALEAAGTEIILIEEIFPEDPVMQWMALWGVARFKAQGHLIDTPEWDRVSESIKPQIIMGSRTSAVDYARAHDHCYELNWLLEDAFTNAPFILTPANAGQAPRIGEDGLINGQAEVGWVQFTYGINMTRNPAGVVCAGLGSAGTPIGLQVIGRHYDEPGVLGLMANLEQLLDFTAKPPMLS